jgi:hypothetical protein
MAARFLWASALAEPARLRLGIRQPAPNDPHAFRLADPVEVRQILAAVGFRDVAVKEIELGYLTKLEPSDAVKVVTDFAGPIAAALLKLDSEQRSEALSEMLAIAKQTDLSGHAFVYETNKST